MASAQIYIINGTKSLILEVKPIGNTGHVYVPKKYIGQKVNVVVING